MGKGNWSYTEAFKEGAIDLAIRSGSITQIAKELGIPVATLHSWVGLKLKDKNGSSPRKNQDLSALFEENRGLHKALAVAEEERDILKKAAAYFAKNQK